LIVKNNKQGNVSILAIFGFYVTILMSIPFLDSLMYGKGFLSIDVDMIHKHDTPKWCQIH